MYINVRQCLVKLHINVRQCLVKLHINAVLLVSLLILFSVL